MSGLLDAARAALNPPRPTSPGAGVRRPAGAPGRAGGKILAAACAAAALLWWVDGQTVAAQDPARCTAGQLAVSVPRPHIAVVAAVRDRPGPALRDVIAEHRPDVAVAAVVAANRAIVGDPMGRVPAADGGIVCLDMPGRATAVKPAGLTLATRPGGVRAVPWSGRRRLTDVEIASAAYRAGFRGRGLVTAVAVALAESGGDSRARCHNANGSLDRGLWQINTVHGWVTDSMADDPDRAAAAAYRISSSGRTWRPWVTFWRGSYRRHLPAAERAARQIGA